MRRAYLGLISGLTPLRPDEAVRVGQELALPVTVLRGSAVVDVIAELEKLSAVR